MRHGDNVWGDIARWVRNALIVAEELGITSKNVDAMKKSSNPEIKRMLGQEGDFGSMLGLPKDWAYNVIKGVGNYSEIYEAPHRPQDGRWPCARLQPALDEGRHSLLASVPLSRLNV